MRGIVSVAGQHIAADAGMSDTAAAAVATVACALAERVPEFAVGLSGEVGFESLCGT